MNDNRNRTYALPLFTEADIFADRLKYLPSFEYVCCLK